MTPNDPLVSIDILKRARMAILAQGLIPESCIASTAIWIAVLRGFGVKAKPVCVKAAAINAQFVEWLQAHNGEFPKDEAGLVALKESGARSVEVGFHTSDVSTAGPHVGAWSRDHPPRPIPKTADGRPGWNGHLLVGVKPRPDEKVGWLIDLAIDAASRPEKGIHVPNPIVIPVPTHIWSVTLRGQMLMRAPLPKGGSVEYVVMPGEFGYTQSLDWRDQKARWRRLVSELTEVIRDYLATRKVREAQREAQR